ncbi:hypothetical protein A3C23_02590 [Candidatus Roizmanbacteria bacterium RIFCSPHIGHO2_02_FULL_37_13b]|uniref:Glycosyltransferase 2-like domain-containing protein n=1 Tax=Candidatus Roizmanbacteria bacterium RIFCSPLOWO2_02_FULL_36_11 TaxID=1802071 RepID=A0A1F7JG05_9BACT|nr:MAG: hypothetical protein A3C23_02590 [Candidatus Roizmanbacteria bacterium RIFCSPHIGHO2_02_FULL_37_13b]OGK54561.1 MAG: hypothetical protein A3H78_01600 [Candidatus Roizmanbacteria bacterium RIFCSPLOWO2_02_FULL_36_11]
MLSVIILAKNENESIKKTIESVSFADETLIIDDDSTDNTVKIAKEMGVRVIAHPLNNDFSKQRNFADIQAKGDWILHIDADEVITNALKEEIQEIVKTYKTFDEIPRQARDDIGVYDEEGKTEIYYIKRRDIWWGRELRFGEVYKAAHTGFIRLYKKGSGKWIGAIHESFQTEKKTGFLDSYLIHRPHPTVAIFLEQINKYSSSRAEELFKTGQQGNALKIIFFPFFKFWYNYLLRFGFLEGAAGFVYAFFMSFHSFLVQSKLYMMHHSK